MDRKPTIFSRELLKPRRAVSFLTRAGREAQATVIRRRELDREATLERLRKER